MINFQSLVLNAVSEIALEFSVSESVSSDDVSTSENGSWQMVSSNPYPLLNQQLHLIFLDSTNVIVFHIAQLEDVNVERGVNIVLYTAHVTKTSVLIR